MNDRCAHVVVPVHGAVPVLPVLMLLKGHGVFVPGEAHVRGEPMRLGDRLGAFQPTAAILHREDLARAVRPHRLDRRRVADAAARLRMQSEHGRHSILEDAQDQGARCRHNAMVLVVPGMIVAVVVAMAVMVATPAEQPNTGEVHGQAECCDRDCLGKMDRHRREQATHGLIADQDCDHCQHDRAGEARQVAQLAGAEAEPGVLGVFAGVAVSQGRQQQRTGMGAHVQPVRDQGNRAESEAAHDLQQHHRPA